MKFAGIFPSLTTPFTPDGELYKTKVRFNVEKLNRTSVAGYLVCGAAGEGALLAADERARIWQWVAEATPSDKLLLAATGAASVRETVALTRRAAECGAKAAVVATPPFADDATQILYFRAVADQSPIPVVVECPAGAGLTAEAAAGLSHHPNIVAIVETSVARQAEILRAAKPGFPVLAGSAATLWPSLSAGAAGAVIGFAASAPYACITIWEAFRTREAEAAEDWQRRIARAAELVETRRGVPSLKHALDFNGDYGGPPRLPLTPPSAAIKREIEEAFHDLKG